MIKSDFFDQKVNVTLIPHPNPPAETARSRENSRAKLAGATGTFGQRRSSKSPEIEVASLNSQIEEL
jgi:hypothetical protein